MVRRLTLARWAAWAGDMGKEMGALTGHRAHLNQAGVELVNRAPYRRRTAEMVVLGLDQREAAVRLGIALGGGVVAPARSTALYPAVLPPTGQPLR